MNENIDVLLQLFGMLKESSDKNEDATQQLIVQQLDLVSHIKHLPIDDLRAALKEHQKTSADDIDACTETVESTTGDLMDELKKISGRVNKMILVVSVAFSLMVGTYILVRSVSDSDTKFNAWQKKIEEKQNSEHQAIADEVIEKLRDEIRKLK